MTEAVATFSTDVCRRLHQAPGGDSGQAGAPFGEILANTGLCWAANGPYLEVLSLTTGERRAQWTFGLHSTSQLVQITCVRQWCAVRHPLLLLVGLDCGASTGGMLCVFDIHSGLVRHSIHIQRGVTSLTPVSRWPATVPATPSTDPPAVVVAVGTQDGLVILLHMIVDQLDSPGYSCEEPRPARLMFLDDVDSDSLCSGDVGVEVSSDGTVSQPALVLNQDAVSEDVFIYRGKDQTPVYCDLQRTWVSCLQYVAQLDSLVVGFSFGGFQLWSLSLHELEFSSRHEAGLLPMLSCVFLEPENDPRHYVYLWTVCSVPAYQDVRGALSVAALFSLLYRERHSNGVAASCSARYSRLRQADVRLVYRLTTSPQRPRPELVSASCLLSAHSLDPPHHQHSQQSRAAGSTRCALLWEAWSSQEESGGDDSHTILAVFDLNEWYAAHLPTTIESGRRPFFRFLRLNVRRGIAMDARVLRGGSDGGESVRVNVLLDVGVEQCVFDSVRACVLRKMELEPSAVLSQAAALYSALLVEQEEDDADPTAVSLPALSADVDEPQREALLTLALRVGCWSVLTACAAQWASDFNVDSPLRWLLDWSWRRAVETVTTIDTLSHTLFDPPSTVTESASATAQILHDAHACIGGLIAVLDEMLTVRECTDAGRDELLSRRHVLRLRRQHCQLLSWLVSTALLPEVSDHVVAAEEAPTHVFVYPCSRLVKWYGERRNRLSADLLMVESLLDNMGEAVRNAWCEEQGDACYPPRSLETATRVFLLDSVTDESRHRFTYYLLLDLQWSFGESLSAVLESFAAVHAISGAVVRILHGFWLLDHGQCKRALTLLLDPGVSNADISQCQLRRALQSLMAQGEHRAALHLSLARFASGSSVEDIRLQVLILLENEMLPQAVRHERQMRGVGDSDHLHWLLAQVEKRGLLLQFSHLMLDECQTAGLIDFLRSSRHQACRDLLYTFFIQRGRYAEACQLQRSGADGSSVSGQLRQCVDKLLTHILPLDSVKPHGNSARNVVSTTVYRVGVSGVQHRQQSTAKQPVSTGGVNTSRQPISALATLKSRSSQIHTDLERDSTSSSVYQHSQTPFRPRGKRRRAEVTDNTALSSSVNDSCVDERGSPPATAGSVHKLRPALRHLLQTPPVRRAKSLLSTNVQLPPIARLKFDRATTFLEHTPPCGSERKRARVDMFDGAALSVSSAATAQTAVATNTSVVATSAPRREDSPSVIHVPTIFTPGRPNISQLVRRPSAKFVNKNTDLIAKQKASVESTDLDDSLDLPAIPTVFTPGKTPLLISSRPSLLSQSRKLHQSDLQASTPKSTVANSDTDHNEPVSIPTIFTPKADKSTIVIPTDSTQNAGYKDSTSVSGSVVCERPAAVTTDDSINAADTVAEGTLGLVSTTAVSDESDASFHSLNASAVTSSESDSRVVMETSPVCIGQVQPGDTAGNVEQTYSETVHTGDELTLPDNNTLDHVDAVISATDADCGADTSERQPVAEILCPTSLSTPHEVEESGVGLSNSSSATPDRKCDGVDGSVFESLSKSSLVSRGTATSLMTSLQRITTALNMSMESILMAPTDNADQTKDRDGECAGVLEDAGVTSEKIEDVSLSSVKSDDDQVQLVSDPVEIDSVSLRSEQDEGGEVEVISTRVAENAVVESEEDVCAGSDIFSDEKEADPATNGFETDVVLHLDSSAGSSSDDSQSNFSIDHVKDIDLKSDRVSPKIIYGAVHENITGNIDTESVHSDIPELSKNQLSPDIKGSCLDNNVVMTKFQQAVKDTAASSYEQINSKSNVVDSPVCSTRSRRSVITGFQPLSPLVEEEFRQSVGGSIGSDSAKIECSKSSKASRHVSTDEATSAESTSAPRIELLPSDFETSKLSSTRRMRCQSEEPVQSSYVADRRRVRCYSEEPESQTTPRRSSRLLKLREESESSLLLSPTSPRAKLDRSDKLTPSVELEGGGFKHESKQRIGKSRRRSGTLEESLLIAENPGATSAAVKCELVALKRPEQSKTPRRRSMSVDTREAPLTPTRKSSAPGTTEVRLTPKRKPTALDKIEDASLRCKSTAPETEETLLTPRRKSSALIAKETRLTPRRKSVASDKTEDASLRRKSTSADTKETPLTPRRRSTAPDTKEVATPTKKANVLHSSEEPSTPRRRSMARNVHDKSPSPQTPRRSSRRQNTLESVCASTTAAVGAVPTVPETSLSGALADGTTVPAALCEEQKGTPGRRIGSRSLRRRSTDSSVDSTSLAISETAKPTAPLQSQRVDPLLETEAELEGTLGDQDTTAQCTTSRRSSRIRQLSVDIVATDTSQSNSKRVSQLDSRPSIKPKRVEQRAMVGDISSQSADEDHVEGSTSTGTPSVPARIGRPPRSATKTDVAPSSRKYNKRRRHTTASAAQPDSVQHGEEEGCEGNDDHFSPIRLLSSEQRSRLLSSTCSSSGSSRTVESPAAKIRRASLKKALRQKSLRRQSVKLW